MRGSVSPSHHNARLAQTHLGYQLLEALALGCRSSRLALVAVDNFDTLGRPTQRDGPLAQSILALGASVFSNTCRSVDWRGSDYLRNILAHRRALAPLIGQLHLTRGAELLQLEVQQPDCARYPINQEHSSQQS